MIESINFQEPIMNYGGGNGSTNNSGDSPAPASASGWENILLNNYFGDGGAPSNGATNNASGADQGAISNTNSDGSAPPGGTTTAPSASAGAPYETAGGYAAYLHANYTLKNGPNDSSATTTSTMNQNSYYGGGATAGLNYGTNARYSLNMPAQQQQQQQGGGQYNPSQYGQAPPTGNNSRYVSAGGESHGGYNINAANNNNNNNNTTFSPSMQPNNNTTAGVGGQFMPQFSLHDNTATTTNTATQQLKSLSDESQPNPLGQSNGNAELYAGYGNYYNANPAAAAATGAGGGVNNSNYAPNNNNGNNNLVGGAAQNNNYPPPPTHVGNNSTTGGGGSTTNTMADMDYCDALLRGMDDPSFGWLAGAFGGGNNTNPTNPNTTNNGTSNTRNNGYNNYPPTTHGNQHQHNNNNMGHSMHHHQGGGGFGGEQMVLPQQQQQTNKATALDAFFVAQQQQQAAAFTQPTTKKYNTRRTTTTTTAKGRARRGKSSRASSAATATTTSSTHLPNRSDHSSLPSVQIDPLLEQISLTVTAVSLSPLSGNEVVRHIRTKTDDVITRFLPCVDFLVNCQQELRQGLQLAQQRQRSVMGGRRGASGGMTPRQFHNTYVAPLPKRFERHNESIMARDHLRKARSSLDQLVRDSQASVPQGCDHVKNTFLGGMRENESWGLRKWLSQHGGAGSICNDLEEVMRHVKALNKEEDTTKRLAEMLRPIARQAHERLKKDVPQAYQEQSSAHPYLPFFHRLESCLKQMATYDPEEDDVICLEDSSDEDEEIKVVAPKSSGGGGAKMRAPNAANSSAVKKHGGKAKPSPMKPSKRKSDEDVTMMKWEGGSELKRSKRGNPEEDFAQQFFGSGGGGEEPVVKNEDNKKKVKEELEIICLDSSDEEEDETDNNAATGVAIKNDESNNLDQSESRLSTPSPPAVQEYQFGQTVPQQQLLDATAAAAAPTGATTGTDTAAAAGGRGQWRCIQCTFLNEAFSTKCVMCNDDDSSTGGGNTSDDLANFLGGSGFLDASAVVGVSNHSFSAESSRSNSMQRLQLEESTTGGVSRRGSNASGSGTAAGALQSADAREIEYLADHITNGGSLPKQAHQNIDPFWGTMDTFPRILLLFRTILQNPTSTRFLEPTNESHLFMIGMPAYSSIVRHPLLCFHEIVSALSRSDDAVKYPHLTMRLANGKLLTSTMNSSSSDDDCDEFQHWNMWNGLHLIEAIDLVLLNSLAYNNNKVNGDYGESKTSQLIVETESLRNVLWDGVNGILKERLQPHERREHMPQRRSANSNFVTVKEGEGGIR
ncbi:hypothetical protein ACHAXR_010838 [Thalassiosira sp. AJA248-18]